MTVRPRPMFIGLVVSAALAFSACSSTGSATAAPTAAGGVAVPSIPAITLPSGIGGGTAATDAGSILTQDVAASIIGGTLTVLPIPSIPGMSIAGYTNTTGGSVSVLVETVPAGAGGQFMQAAIQAAGAQGNLQSFSGLGDAAGKVIAANAATVVFTKGTTLVVVNAASAASSGADLDAKIEPVAQQIAGKV